MPNVKTFTQFGQAAQYERTSEEINTHGTAYNSEPTIYTRNGVKYILKKADSSLDSKREVYSAWLYRMLVGNGNIIPEYTRPYSESVGSKMVDIQGNFSNYGSAAGEDTAPAVNTIANKILERPNNL